MLYDANNKPIEETIQSQSDEEGYENVPSFNFPPPNPKPEWFDRKLLEIGGYVPGTEIPKYRVVWGMEEKQFAMGEMHLKYVAVIDLIQTTVGYNVIHIKNPHRKPQFLKPEEAHARYMDPNTKLMTRNTDDGVLIQPVVKEEEREIGTPLWCAEYFMEPEGFGTEKAWEATRYMVNPQDPRQAIDVLGPYPKQGRYIEWFQFYGIDENGRIEYKDLDEDAVDLVRANHAFNEARRKNMQHDTIQKRQERRDDKFESDWAEFDRELTTEILDVKKNRKFQNTGVIDPGKG